MSYKGTTVQVPVAVDGVWGRKVIPVTGLLKGRNLTLENNVLEKEGGSVTQNLNNALPSDIMAALDWFPDPVTQRYLAVTKGGGVRRDTGAWTFPTTVLAEGTLTIAQRPPHLVEVGSEAIGNNRKVFLFTGNDPVKVGSGDFLTMATLATPPADWTGTRQPTGGVIHAGRLWAWLNHILYYSQSTNHENFTGAGAGQLVIAPGVGQFISAAWSYRENLLAVFKFPRGIFLVDTSSNDVTQWTYQTQSLAVGTAGPWCVVPVPNDLLFPDSDFNAFHLLSATDVLRDAESSDISTPKLSTLLKDLFDGTRTVWVQGIWHGLKKQAWFACSALGSTKNNRRIVWDFNNPSVGPRFTYSDRHVNQSLTLRQTTTGVLIPHAGTDTGFVIALDQATRSDDAVGYMGQFQLDHTDLGEVQQGWASKPKHFDFADFELQGTGDYTLSINVYLDGVLKTSVPLSVSLTGSGVPLGTFVLGTDKLSAGARKIVRLRLLWTGVLISLEGFNAVAGQNFQVSRLWIGARLVYR